MVKLTIVRYLRGLKFEELCAGISQANLATPSTTPTSSQIEVCSCSIYVAFQPCQHTPLCTAQQPFPVFQSVPQLAQSRR